MTVWLCAVVGLAIAMARTPFAPFVDPRRARLLYPAMKAGRRLALRLLGRRMLQAP